MKRVGHSYGRKARPWDPRPRSRRPRKSKYQHVYNDLYNKPGRWFTWEVVDKKEARSLQNNTQTYARNRGWAVETMSKEGDGGKWLVAIRREEL